MKQFFTFATFCLGSLIFVQPASALRVDWKVYGPNPINFHDEAYTIQYTYVLKYRPEPKAPKGKVVTLEFNKPKDADDLMHAFFMKLNSGRVKLNEQSSRDELAKIFARMPCPRAKIEVKSFFTRNPALRIVAPELKADHTYKAIIIDGCLNERVPECILPMGGDPQYMMTYIDLVEGFERCRKAMVEAIKTKGLVPNVDH
jgi:hypothetical protein